MQRGKIADFQLIVQLFQDKLAFCSVNNMHLGRVCLALLVKANDQHSSAGTEKLLVMEETVNNTEATYREKVDMSEQRLQ